MAITAQTLIQNAFESIGVYAPGETLASADSSTGLYVLNMLIDEWASQGIFVQQYTTLSISITSGKASYTIGPVGADVTAARPISVEYGPTSATVTVSAVTTNMNSVSSVEWSAIQGNSSSSGTPDTVWYDPQYPLGVLNVSPTPNATGTLQVNAFSSVVTNFPLLSTSVALSIGSQNALQNNLALALIAYYKDINIGPAPRLQADGAEGKYFLRYNSLTSRAMLNRRMITAGQSPPPPAKGE